MSARSGLNLTALTTARGLDPPSPFLAGVARFFLVDFFQSSSEPSWSELDILDLLLLPLPPFFFPGDFLPGL